MISLEKINIINVHYIFLILKWKKDSLHQFLIHQLSTQLKQFGRWAQNSNHPETLNQLKLGIKSDIHGMNRTMICKDSNKQSLVNKTTLSFCKMTELEMNWCFCFLPSSSIRITFRWIHSGWSLSMRVWIFLLLSNFPKNIR